MFKFINNNVDKNKRFSIALILALLSFFFMPTRAQIQAQTTLPSYIAVLTKDIKKKQPNVKFHCREKVFLAFAWLGLHGNHRISALWFNPLGKQQDQIDFEFSTDQPKIENWVSLKFRDASDQTNPFLSDFFSPQLNGQWQVKVFLDGNFLDTLRFEVRCG